MKTIKDYYKYFTLIEKLNVIAVKNSTNVTSDMAYKYLRGESLPSLKKAVNMEDDFNIPSSTWVYFQEHKSKGCIKC